MIPVAYLMQLPYTVAGPLKLFTSFPILPEKTGTYYFYLALFIKLTTRNSYNLLFYSLDCIYAETSMAARSIATTFYHENSRILK